MIGGDGTMAYTIFLRGAHLCKALSVAVGEKYGIVTEASFPMLRCEYGAVNTPFEVMDIIACKECYAGDEVSRPVGDSFEIMKQQSCVGLRIMPWTGISRGSDSGLTVECSYYKPAVVSETIVAEMLLYVHCFLQSVATEGIGSLGNIGIAAYIGKREYGETVAQNRAYLTELVGVVGCKYYCMWCRHL